jgi:hypothetical protein
MLYADSRDDFIARVKNIEHRADQCIENFALLTTPSVPRWHHRFERDDVVLSLSQMSAEDSPSCLVRLRLALSSNWIALFIDVFVFVFPYFAVGHAERAHVPRTHGFADYQSLGIPSFSINSYSVGRLTPSSTAAEVIFPR